MKKKAVILHSGGLDSTTCLLLAQKQGYEVLSLGIDYGQRHRIELEFAQHQCSRFSIQRKVIRVEWDKPKRELPCSRTISEMKSSVSSAFLPGRNAVFLTLAFAEAAGIGANEVWIGVNSLDYSGYPDCRIEFIKAFQAMQRRSIPGGAKLKAPLLKMGKPRIAKLAQSLGLSRDEVWSCYRPALTDEGIAPCHKCDACVLHEFAWAKQ